VPSDRPAEFVKDSLGALQWAAVDYPGLVIVEWMREHREFGGDAGQT